MMLGFLLARAGIEVVVLEKHGDFLRDFRGDTIHASTLELMHELGLLDTFLTLPHQEARQLRANFGDVEAAIDFTHLPTQCKFIALMPQWDFLNFIGEHAARYPTSTVKMLAEVTELIVDGDRTVGVRANTADGPVEIWADLVVGTDGRHSTVRRCAGLEVEDLGAPMDVLWMRLPRRPTDGSDPAFLMTAGTILVTIDRGTYWQCAFVIPKGGYEALRDRGLSDFRKDIASVAPFLGDRVDTLESWDDVKLLTVCVDRLRQWHRPGLLCIGDAAHAMSPIGGVGINLAIQDAVAAANLLFGPLREGKAKSEHLQKVQERRMFPTRMTQRLQVAIQNSVIKEAMVKRGAFKPPVAIRLLALFPWLRRIPGRLVGIGLRPEHVRTPDIMAAAQAGRPNLRP
jgi:2-polyprenyl-6-methoxyphenol hydroxylase-like FAD-dependent oxidoreductase